MASKSPRKQKIKTLEDKFWDLNTKITKAEDDRKYVDISHLDKEYGKSRIMSANVTANRKNHVAVPAFKNLYTNNSEAAAILYDGYIKYDKKYGNVYENNFEQYMSIIDANLSSLVAPKSSGRVGRPKKPETLKSKRSATSPKSPVSPKPVARRSKKEQELLDLYVRNYSLDEIVDIISSRSSAKRKFSGKTGHIPSVGNSPRGSPQRSPRTMTPMVSSPRSSPRNTPMVSSPRTTPVGSSPRGSTMFTAMSSAGSSPRSRLTPTLR